MSIKEKYKQYKSGRARFKELKAKAYQEEYEKERIRHYLKQKGKARKIAAAKAKRNIAPVRYYAEKVGTGAKYTGKGLKEVGKGVASGTRQVRKEFRKVPRRPPPKGVFDPLGLYKAPTRKKRGSSHSQTVYVYAGDRPRKKRKKRRRQQSYGLSYDWGI
jgi:hypothetical protein